MSTPIARCPPEVLIGFIEASERTDRRTLRRVDKTWMSLATPLAFDSLVLEATKESAERMLELIRMRLARWAKTLEFCAEDRSDFLAIGDPTLVQVTHPDPVSRMVFTILTRLTAVFPLLERFNVRLFSGRFTSPLHLPVSPEELTGGVPKYIVQSTHVLDVLSTVGDSPPPHLKTLVLRNLLPVPGPSMMEPGFRRIMEQVESLTISVHRARSLDHQDYWECFWVDDLPAYVLAPTQPRLTSLSLTSDQPVGHILPGIDFSVLHFPALRHLKLGGFCFDLDGHLEDFIIKHQATLTSLVLDSCPMWTGADFQNKMPRRRWSQTFARLDGALAGLMYVRVMCKFLWGLNVEDSPRTEMALTYETSTSGYGYNRGEQVDVTVERDDRWALEKFYTTVDARRQRVGLGTLERGSPSERGRLPHAGELPRLMEMLLALR